MLRRGFLQSIVALVVAPSAAAVVKQLPTIQDETSFGRGPAMDVVAMIRDKNVLTRAGLYAGVPSVSFRNIPVRVVDKLV